MEKYKFTKGVERLINPINVGTLHFLQSFNENLSPETQKKLMKKSAKKNSLMGFVVDPYCYFLCYEIIDTIEIEKELPPNFTLEKTKIFADDEEEKYYFILGTFNARTSAFMGNRIEAYAIAKNQETNMTSWVILDYDTNTISYDSKRGLTAPNAEETIITTNFDGEVVVDITRNNQERQIKFTSNIKNGEFHKLDSRLWIEGNLSVAYGTKLSEDGDVFSLRFDPREMDKALNIPLCDLRLETNTWYRSALNDMPSKLVCFPYAQHFVSDSPGYTSNLKDENELVSNITNIDFDDVEVYSTTGFKKMILLVPIVLVAIIVIQFLVIIYM